MSIQVECPRCKKQWFGVKKGGGEVCTKCGRKIPNYDRVYRIRQRVRQSDGTVIQHTKYLGKLRYKEWAEKIALEMKVNAREGIAPTERNPTEKTWQDMATAYLKKVAAEGKSATYQTDARLYLRRMGDFWGKQLPISKITRELYLDFREHLLTGKATNAKRKPSKKTCDLHHSAAKAAWDHSAYDLANPFKRVKLFNEPNSVTRFLASAQRIRLLQAAKDINLHLFQIIVVALATGLRRMDVQALRRDEVDFERGIAEVGHKRWKTSCGASGGVCGRYAQEHS